MENKISSVDKAEQRSTNLDMPLSTPDVFNPVVTMFRNDVEQRMQLASGQVELETFIMCQEIVNAVSVSALEAVEPQVTNSGASSASTTGEKTEQEKTQESEKLMELIGDKVVKKVNHKQSLMAESTSSQQTKESEAASTIDDVVPLVADILRRCKTESGKYQTWLDCDELEGCCPDEVSPVEELRQSSDLAGRLSEDCSARSTEELQPDGTFLAVFLWRLLDHIATETRTPIGVAFYGMLARLTEMTEEELSSTLPQTATNLHICIYEELCQEFGSAEELLSAVVSTHVAFEEAVARTLKVKLKKSKNTVSFLTKARRFFRKKTSKVAQACEKNTDEVGNQVTPQKKKKRSRVLSSIENHLRRTFISYSRAFQEPTSIPVFMY